MLLSACQTAPLSQPSAAGPHQAVSAGTSAKAVTVPTAAALRSDSLQVDVHLAGAKAARDFSVANAVPAQAAYVRLSVKAADLASEYTNSGGISLNGVDHLIAITGTSTRVTISGIPKGRNRLVIAQIYDVDGKELTSFRAMGLYHSADRQPAGSTRFGDENTGTEVIEQVVNRRNLPLLSMLEQAIDAKNTAFLTSIETHLDQLAVEFDKLVYGANTPGTTFFVDPQRIDPGEIYADLNTQIQSQTINLDTGLPAYFSGNATTFVDNPVNLTVFLATPTGFNFTQNFTVAIDDPSSSPVSVTATGQASPISATLTNVTRGTRRLNVYDGAGKLLAHTLVTVDPDTGVSFANGAGSAAGQPLVLLGNETGVSISSLSTGGAVAGTPISLNGVGYSGTGSDNTVKFGSTAVALGTTTPTTIQLNTPDLIGGTYPVTVTRLGVVSNFQNFNVIPAINSLSATSGLIGSSLTLTGTGFHPTAGSNSVSFGGINVTPSAATPDGHSLTLTVPANAFGTRSLTATVGGQTSAGSNYEVKPLITSISASSGVIGSSLTLNGTGFDPTSSGDTVSFGGVNATITSASNTQLVVDVPPGIWGTRNLTVKVGNQTSDPVSYEVIPTISSTSPGGGLPGIFITLNGTGFSPVTSENTVKFKSIFFGVSVNANVTQTSNTQLKLTVFPSFSGTHNVTVTVDNQTSGNAPFTSIFLPVINSFTPAAGAHVGDSIQIDGAEFDPTPANNVVHFGGPSGPTGTVTAASTTQLTVTVPAGVSGQPDVTVTTNGNTNTGTHTYTIIPQISGISAASGRIGTQVTLTGTGFNTSPALETVSFNGKTATIIGTPTQTSMVVRVPGSSLDQASSNFTITTYGQTSNGQAFSAIATTPCVDSGFSPAPTDPLKFTDCLDAVPPGPYDPDFNLATSNGLGISTDRFGQAKALTFNGVNSYRKEPYDIGPNHHAQITLNLWARFIPGGPYDTGSDVFALLSHDDGPFDRSIEIDPRGGTFSWSAFAGAVLPNMVSGSAPIENQWQMITAVYDNTAQTAKIYVDGVLKGTSTTAVTNTGYGFFLLGKNPGFPDKPFPGQVDDVTIYDRTLSDTEVLNLYNATKP